MKTKTAEKILKIIKEKPILRKELTKKLKSFKISENSMDFCIHKLKKKGLIIKNENHEYKFYNPFLEILKIEDPKERQLETYKKFIELISPDAKWKILKLIQEAMHLNNKKEE